MKMLFNLTLCLTIICNFSIADVHIPDPNLKSAIELKLRKRPRDSITNEDMARLHSLIIRDQEIKDLTGLEHAINIRNLDLKVDPLSMPK